MNFIKNKFLSFLIVLLLTAFLQVMAADIEVQPTMSSKSNAQDRVWVGTIQLVWNEFIDKYIHGPVRFREGTPSFVNALNKKNFTAANLSNESYYLYSGNITKNTAKNIKKSIKKKFNETSDIVDNLNLIPGSNNFLIYAMLKKNFEFPNEFDKLGEASFGAGMQAEYFGINNNSGKDISDSASVLYYNNKNDFAMILKTKGNDEVYLYKNSANKEFSLLYRDMKLKASKYTGLKTFEKNDELKVPNIKFDISKNFDELSGKRVMGTNILIDKVVETVKFNMDSKGVQLKSEAAMTFEKTAVDSQEKTPRYFYLDDTFIIFLKEKGKARPYFALRVNNITKFR